MIYRTVIWLVLHWITPRPTDDITWMTWPLCRALWLHFPDFLHFLHFPGCLGNLSTKVSRFLIYWRGELLYQLCCKSFINEEGIYIYGKSFWGYYFIRDRVSTLGEGLDIYLFFFIFFVFLCKIKIILPEINLCVQENRRYLFRVLL